MGDNNLNQLTVANMSENELRKVKELEGQLGDKYYIIAFEKNK